MKRLILTLCLVAGFAASAAAQAPPGGAVVTYCNSAGSWIPCTNGSGGGGSGGTTQDADDASIATGQTADLVLAATMAYDGTVWRRLTFGVAGTASAQVLTVQGIAGMTPLLATVSATNLDVQIGGSDTLSAIGTLANDGAAAGTNRVATLPGLVENSAPTRTDGRNAGLSFTTGGAARVMITNAAGAASSLASDVTEDAAETAGGTGPSVMSVRRDTAASSAGTTGDNATFNTDGLGRLWVREGGPCADHSRLSVAAIGNSTSGNVEVVALNGSDLIYVCGYSLMAGATTGVRFVYGTGTACATGETGLTGIWPFAANGGIAQANAGVPQFVVPAGNAFCTENSGANSIQGHVLYVRTAAP